MNQSLQTLNESNPKTNADVIVQSFAVPEWYLKGFETNIRVRTETVTAVTDGVSFNRILDIGCGDGSLTLPLLPRSKHITYLDQSLAMLDRVAARIGKQDTTDIRYLNSGFMEAELPLASFDLVTCIGVLAYVQDLNAFLRKVHSVLKPGGRLLLECTDAHHFLSRTSRFYGALTSLLKPKRFGTQSHRAAEVVAATEALGLRLEKSFCYTHSLPVLEKLIPHPTAYKLIRSVYGDITDNRRAWLGNECLFYFKYPTASGRR